MRRGRDPVHRERPRRRRGRERRRRRPRRPRRRGGSAAERGARHPRRGGDRRRLRRRRRGGDPGAGCELPLGRADVRDDDEERCRTGSRAGPGARDPRGHAAAARGDRRHLQRARRGARGRGRRRRLRRFRHPAGARPARGGRRVRGRDRRDHEERGTRMNIGTMSRMTSLPRTQRIALTAALVALGVVLGSFAIPVGPARVAPFQHFINVLAGVLVGPWYAVLAAFVEPVGTAIVGALVGYALIAPLETSTFLLGFIKANPPSAQPYLGLFGGPLFLVASFAVSSIPGSTLGYIALRALRRAGIAF